MSRQPNFSDFVGKSEMGDLWIGSRWDTCGNKYKLKSVQQLSSKTGVESSGETSIAQTIFEPWILIPFYPGFDISSYESRNLKAYVDLSIHPWVEWILILS